LSKKDVFSFEMRSLYETRDRELERILSGKSPADGRHDDLYVLAGELQNAFPQEPVAAEVERAHLVAMIEASRLAIEESESVVVRGTEAGGTAAQKPWLWKKRRKLVHTNRFPSLLATVASLTLGVFAIFGGVAAAGVLPDSLQSTVWQAVAHVGLNIPEGSGSTGAPGVPDHVTLPDQAKVPASVPGPASH
jgi:hypothetical protein